MRWIFTFSMVVLIWSIGESQVCPNILGVQLSCENATCEQVCPGQEITLIMDIVNPRDGDEYEWFYADNPGFNPLIGEGTPLGTETVQLDPCQSGNCPQLIAANINACGSESNEYMLLHSGSGFEVSDLFIDFDQANNTLCNTCGDLGSGGGCSFLLTPNVNIPSCPDFIPAGPGDRIPGGATVIVFVSSQANGNATDFTNLCNNAAGIPSEVYVLQSECDRLLTGSPIGAFTNTGGNEERFTTVSFCGGCMRTFNYNLSTLNNIDGETWVEVLNLLPCPFAYPEPSGPFVAPSIIYTVKEDFCDMDNVHFKGIYTPSEPGCTPILMTPNTFLQDYFCPQIEIIAPQSLCEGETAEIRASSNDWEKYRWDGEVRLNFESNEPILVGPGYYELVVSDLNSCFARDEVTIESKPIPDPVIDIQPSDTICPGDSVDISLSGAIYFITPENEMLLPRFTLTYFSDTIIPFTAEMDGCTFEDTIFLYTDPLLCNSLTCDDTKIIDSIQDTLCLKDFPLRILVNVESYKQGTGNWEGSGIIDTVQGLFDPEVAGIGIHPLTFTYQLDTCEFIHYDTVVVTGISADFQDGGTYCRGEGNLDLWVEVNGDAPYTVFYTVDDNLAQSTPPSMEDSILISIPYNQINSKIVINGYSSRFCFDTLEVINYALVIDDITGNFGDLCNPSENTWQPLVELSGDPNNAYGVAGHSGTFNGSVYTGDPIPVGTEFTAQFFGLTMHCDTLDVLLPSPSCICNSQAGAISASADTFTLCRETVQPLTINHDGNEVLDNNDGFRFILHDGRPDSIGEVKHWNTTGTFNFPVSMSLDPGLYYIQAVVANLQGDTLNLLDGCLNYSNAIPIVIRSFPTLFMRPVAYGCESGFVDIPIPLSGDPPYKVYYESDGQERLTTTMTDSFTISLNFDQDDTFRVLRIEDQYCLGEVYGETMVKIVRQDTGTYISETCETAVQIGDTRFDPSNPAGLATLEDASFTGCDSFVQVSITFLPPPEGFVQMNICSDDTIMINQTAYHQSNPIGTEILVDGSVEGCDSIIQVNLIPLAVDTAMLSPTACAGNSFVFGGMTFDEQNPTGVISIPDADSKGCDSIVAVDIQFETPDTTHFSPTLCWDETININGNLYGAQRPSGYETIVTSDPFDCDSTIRIDIILPDTIRRSIQACSGDMVMVGNKVFDENNSSGLTLVEAENGCDTLFNIEVEFLEDPMGFLNPMLCPEESILLAGVTFDINNPTGNVRLIGASASGCDSVIDVSLQYINPILRIEQTLCSGSIFIFGETEYNESFPYDSIILPGAARNSCDSTIVIDLAFEDSIVVQINTNLCTGETIMIGDQVFDEDNPNGRVFFGDGSVNGCDSIVLVDLTYQPEVLDTLNPVICPGSFITVNGFRYDQTIPEGLEVISGGTSNGCDSMIYVNLDFAPMEPFIETRTIGCEGQQERSVYIGGINSGLPPYLIVIDQADTFETINFPLQVDVDQTAEVISVQILDATGCLSTEILNFENDSTQGSIQLVGDDHLFLGESTTINLSTNFPIDQYTIVRSGDDSTCVNCLPITITPLNTVSYKVVARGENGCILEDVLTIQVDGQYRIFIPNIFSPNADGINDDFRIFPGLNLVKINAFRIFDYWGEMLFEALDYYPDDSQPAWDGTHRGQYLNPGVFAYTLEASFIDGNSRFITGSLTLVR